MLVDARLILPMDNRKQKDLLCGVCEARCSLMSTSSRTRVKAI